jgi:hypothetical protein
MIESKEPKEEGFRLPEEEINEGDEELAVPETVSRKRSFSDISSVSTPPEPVLRRSTRGQGK